MSHELVKSTDMAYVGEHGMPWHHLGVSVQKGISPKEIMKVADLGFTVAKIPAFAMIDGQAVYVGKEALVRQDTNAILDVVSEDWNILQNEQAFEFFDEFCREGNMNMETAGQLKGGQLVWGLAKINESFELFRGKDKVDAYMLFTNPHLYGWSVSVSFTAVRVVCWNTLTLSLNTTKSDKIVRVSHRKEFITEQVKDALGISRHKLAEYKEAAEFLAKKKATKGDLVTYFKKVFPVLTKKTETTKEMSKSAKTCVDILPTQPGAELGEGTFWQGYNTVTYFTDHLAGRSDDSRLTSAWYGVARNLKVKALEMAVEMANQS